MLTTWYTEHAVDFIQRNKSESVPALRSRTQCRTCRCSAARSSRASPARDLYGDVMMEIDWSVGEIMKALKSAGVEDNTLVIFTSDNGPWTSYGNHAGKTPFREAKGTGFDGGTRSACIMRYPGQIKAGSGIEARRSAPIDLLPTIAAAGRRRCRRIRSTARTSGT